MTVITLSNVRLRVWLNSATRSMRDANWITVEPSTTTTVEIKFEGKRKVNKFVVKGANAAQQALKIACLSDNVGGTSVLATDSRWV